MLTDASNTIPYSECTANATQATQQYGSVWNISSSSGDLFFVPHPSLSAAVVQSAWVHDTAPTDTWLVDILRRIETAPSIEAGCQFKRDAKMRFGADCVDHYRSMMLEWHYSRLTFGEEWRVLSDERGAARVALRFGNDAAWKGESEADWDNAWYLLFVDDRVPNESRVLAIIAEYTRDIDADAELAAALFRRCGLGMNDRSNWIVERNAVWPSDDNNIDKRNSTEQFRGE